MALFAVLQLIILMVPEIWPSHRAPATEKIVENAGGNGEDLTENGKDPLSTVNPCQEGSEGCKDESSRDTIPEVLPPARTIKRALESYHLNEKRCLVPTDHYTEIESLREDHNEKREDYKDQRTPENLKRYRRAVKRLALKLVDLELLEDFKTEGPEPEEGFPRFDLGELSANSSSPDEGHGIWLNADNPEDFEKIMGCHYSKLEELPTIEERRAYFKTHMEKQYIEALIKNINSSERLRALANNFQSQSDSADAMTHSKYGIRYGSIIHIKASQIANQYIRSINENPTPVNIQTAQNTMNSELITLSQQLKTQAGTQLVGNVPAIAAAHKKIDEALQVWNPQNINMIQNSSVNTGESLPLITSSPGTVMGSPVTSSYEESLFTFNQGLLPGTTALPEIRLSNVSPQQRPQSGFRIRPNNQRAHIDHRTIRRDNRYRRPSPGR